MILLKILVLFLRIRNPVPLPLTMFYLMTMVTLGDSEGAYTQQETGPVPELPKLLMSVARLSQAL